MTDMTGYSIKILPRKYCRRQTPRDEMKHLPPRDRIILAASSVATCREIGQVLHISHVAVLRRIKKARGV
jgi:hypothetical protein